MKNIEEANFALMETTPEDAQDILDYLKVVGGESHNLTFGKEGIALSVSQEQKMLAEYQMHPFNRQWKAVVNGELAGLCDLHCFPRKRMAHRAEFGISVQKKFWHQGIGSAMMNLMLDHARAQETVTILSIEVIEDNESAISLYESFGFQKVGYLRKFFYVDGQYYGAYLMDLDV